MSVDIFRQSLEKHSNGQPISTQAAAEAQRNLSGFMSLLITINEREQVVPTKPARKPPHENQ
ncbi:MAG: hypothetical protein H6861_08240 [Rhodospirillales bacterium]|nr:hypothetical protein [Rhodospirillales bacterium]